MYAFTYSYAILKSKGSDCMFDENTLTEPAKDVDPGTHPSSNHIKHEK